MREVALFVAEVVTSLLKGEGQGGVKTGIDLGLAERGAECVPEIAVSEVAVRDGLGIDEALGRWGGGNGREWGV